MASIIDVLNSFLTGLIPGEEAVTGLGSIYFLLIFVLIFSIMFAASAFIPMFQDKKKYDNIRILIALSIAFLTSISSYSIIVEQLQFFGLIAAIALGISIAILAVTPKDKRKDFASKAAVIGIIGAFIVLLVFIEQVDWLAPVRDWVLAQYTNLLDSGMMFWAILISISIIIIAVSISRSLQKED